MGKEMIDIRSTRKCRQAYAWQKHNAKRRGIRWRFTYQSWCDWWESNLGPDWFEKRGRGRGKYCMSRKGDTGVYSKDNTLCVKYEDNLKEARRLELGSYNKYLRIGSSLEGSAHGRAKLTEPQIIEIRSSTLPNNVLAVKHEVSNSLISKIKRKLLWTHI